VSSQLPAAAAEHAAPSDTHRARALGRALERLLSIEDPALQRLASAETRVTFVIPAVPSASVTLLLDRNPPTLTDGSDPAEIELELTPWQAERMAEGQLNIPCEAHVGHVAYRGPVRKYLAVDPVLRHLLGRANRGRGDHSSQSDSGA
jgi:hypothetical protein